MKFALTFLLLLAAILFIAPLAQQEVFTLRDHLDYFQPLRHFTAEELRAGRLPLWNPYNASGEPWLANPQTGVFYPPAWLFLVLPFATAYMLYLFLHLALLGVGSHLLFARSVSPGAALVGAAALMFSGPVLSLLDVSNNLATFAWIPLALWCATAGAWRRGGVALALAFLAGEPFFAALAALAYLVVAAVVVRRTREIAATALLAFGLCAVQLLPFLAMVAVSDRAAGMDAASILQDSMTARDWLRVVWPLGIEGGQHFLPVVYVGLTVLALALIGSLPFAVRGSRERDRNHEGGGGASSPANRELRTANPLPWLALLAGAIVIASGPAFVARLPLAIFRYPARLLPFAALAIAALAAAGWDRVRRDRRWLDLVLVLVVVADLLPHAQPLLRAEPFRRHPVRYPPAIGASAKFLRFGEADPAHREAWIAGYLNLYDRRFDAFTAAPVIAERYLRYYSALVKQPTHAGFAAGAIGFMITRYALDPPFVPIARDGDVIVYENRNPTPMAAHIWREPVAMRPARWTLDTSHARVTIDAPHDGILVLRQQNAAGWRVTIDGAPAQSLVIDGVFRGVRLMKGRHEVVWTYRPKSLFIGAVMTLITLAALQISIIVKRSHVS